MKLLSPLVHGMIDYLIVILLVVAPSLVGFAGTPAVLCYVLALLHLILSVLTAYPLGAVKVIPFTAHGSIELIEAVLLIVLPWAAGFADAPQSRNFFVIVSIIVFLVWATTQYRTGHIHVRGSDWRPHQQSGPQSSVS